MMSFTFSVSAVYKASLNHICMKRFLLFLFFNLVFSFCFAQLNVTIQNNLACSTGLGTVTFNVSGGTPPYTINWNGPSATVGTPVSITQAKYYSYTITDASPTPIQKQGSIDANPFVVNISQTLPMCPNNYSVSAYPSGGVEPISYAWSNGATSSAISASSFPGTITLNSVSDSRGCQASGNQISPNTFYFEPYPVVSSFTTTEDDGSTNGTITAIGSYLTLPNLVFEWKKLPSGTPFTTTSATVTALAAGDYSLKVKLNTYCIYYAAVTATVLSNTTDLNRNETLGSSILIAPNPVEEAFTIFNNSASEFECFVYNSNGVMVLQQTLYSGNTRLDSQEWPSGIYYISFLDGASNLIKSEILVKK